MGNLHIFFITLSTLMFSTVFALSLLSEERLDVYMALFAVEFFVASEFASPFTPNQRRRKNILGMIMLIMFAGILAIRIVEILG